jgi:Uma2 family endonuclease
MPEPTRKRWTREEYYRLGEQGWFSGQRVELIDGEIIILSPQSPQHVFATDLVREALVRIFGDQYWVRYHAPLPHGDFSEPEPDLSVVKGPALKYATAHPTTSLLLVEVSRSSLRYDKNRKLHLYAAMGVPEYWILDLNGRQLMVHRHPEADASAPFGYAYASVQTIAEPGAISPMEKPNAVLAVAELLPPAP